VPVVPGRSRRDSGGKGQRDCDGAVIRGGIVVGG